MNIKRSVILVASAVALSACNTKPETENTAKLDEQIWLEQGWTAQQRLQYHYTSQGTATIPMPYEWFVSLEQPLSLDIKKDIQHKTLSEPGYLSDTLGFLPGTQDDRLNPKGLPVGFALQPDFPNAVLEKRVNALGLTCAACHTGQMEYGGQRIMYDGGAATSDLTALTGVLASTMIETRLFPTRFNRFAKRVLTLEGKENTAENRAELKKDFTRVLLATLKAGIVQALAEKAQNAELDIALAAQTESKKLLAALNAGDINAEVIQKLRTQQVQSKAVTEGFTRLDALNRIGNTVFGLDAHIPKNFRAESAPVNYPHIWTTSWFDWVQYDGSVMQPMIRNAGESLGVFAGVNLQPGEKTAADGTQIPQYASTIPLNNLYWMEEMLAGRNNPYEQKKFGGLQSPRWPEQLLPPVDKTLAKQGEQLYVENCEKCHLPPIDSERFWKESVWAAKGTNDNRLIAMNLIPLDTIGTDSAQADVLVNRTVDVKKMDLQAQIYLVNGDKLKARKPGQYQLYAENGSYTDGCAPVDVNGNNGDILFAAALGATVQNVNDHWYNVQGISDEKRNHMDGDRLNCLQAGAGYKARPLNGIWATAPFLHNGSVPTLYHLLSPQAERPDNIFLGSLKFDPVKVGYEYQSGPFQLDTSKQGNTNVGHEFTDARSGKGVIGRHLKEQERWALVEYLKTL